MSNLDKMSIQGIRSFGPDDQDRQVLKFYSPLTLILGPNGTGKTTIIECLKYITTGSLPAGGKLQSTFIHDPKIAHESMVKAQVRLKFKNTTRKVCTVTRSIQALQQMVSLLGVGKPVLENVIFCHQEDSTWPLSEGKALKAKFDDIFASTRYVKALDSILKVRKEMAIKIKEDQLEIRYLKQNKDKSQQIKGDLNQAMSKYEACALSTKEIDDKLAPINGKLLKIEESASDMRKLHTDVEKMKSERNEMERGMNELRDSIAEELPDSTEDLETSLSEFADQVMDCEQKLKKYESENRRLETQLNEISETKSELLLQMGKLEQEAKGHEENLQRRENKIGHVADSYGFSGFSGALTDATLDRFNEKLKEHRARLGEDGKLQKDKLEEQEVSLSSKIFEINNQISSLNTEIRLKEDQMNYTTLLQKENKSKIREIQKKLSRAQGSNSRLSDIKREIKHAKQERDEAEKNTNVDELKKEIEELSAQKGSLEPGLKKLETELTKMHQESTVRTQLDMLKKDTASKDENIRKLLSKNEDALTELLEQVPDDRVGRQLELFIFNLDKSIEKETKALEQHRMELAGKRQEHSSLMEQLSRKKAKLRENRDRLAVEINNEEYDEVRAQLEEKLKIKNEDKGVLDGTSAMFTRYKSRLSKANAQCPLCHRDFDDEADIAELVDELEKKLRTLPQKLESVEADIQELQEKFNSVLALEPVTRSIRAVETTEIPDLERCLKTVGERVDVLTKTITQKDIELKEKLAKSAAGNAMVPDLTTVDRYRRELRELNKKIAAQSAKVSGDDIGRTLPQVQSEKDDIQDRLETARESYDRKQRKLMNHQQVIAQLDSNINELGKEQLDLQSDLQEQKENEAKLEEFGLINEVLFAEIDECRENIGPLNDEMKKLKREQQDIVAEKERQMAGVRDALSKLQERSRDIRTIQENINRYLRAGRDAALDDCRQKQAEVEASAEGLETRRSGLLVKLKKRQEELQTQKMKERNLQDNLGLRRKKNEIKKRSEKILTKEQELGGLDVNRLESQRQQLSREHHKLTKEKHQSEGRQQGTKDQIRSFRKELETDQFKDAEEKHRKRIVTLRTSEVASCDLEKYYRALDATIMNYHKTKIDDINKIIRELWRNTYKGNDIETIEVRSDVDESFQFGKRRHFNYRVVMVKGDVKLDMRGRCSAGQKVLASLIIRLALAETFCLNCGVLALDEPTTNLDRENIESLAFALVEIIKNRCKQKNFQLVIITHDEDFVELLGRSDYVEKFVKVCKNDFGCSRLKEANVSELHAR